MVALWVELLTTLRKLPVGRDEPWEDVRRAVAMDVPQRPLPRDELLAYLRTMALDHSMLPGHPGFMAYISGAGTVPGAAADLLAAALNQNVGGWLLSPAATEIELQLTRWLARQLGLPDGAMGLVTSGGAMANLTALKVARDQRAGANVQVDGVGGGASLVLYASAEAHWVITRAADILGLGRRSVRAVPVDAECRMNVGELERFIREDRAAGMRPFAVVATAGTTSTGAIDPLPDIASVCAAHELWLHVDAAYGGAVALAPELRDLLRGIERADSVVLDPHKWLYTPLAGGCVIVRDGGMLLQSFGSEGSYLYEDKELSGRGLDLGNLGPQFSRGFAALKVWVSLLAHGSDAYARRIRHDVELARYLYARAAERPEFEPVGRVTLSIACFRYVPARLRQLPDRDAYLNTLNERLLFAIQLDGRTFCSNAVLNGVFVLRACITNFRTEAVDIDTLLDVAAEHGARIDAELVSAQ